MRLALAPATSGSRPPWRQVMLCVGDMLLTVCFARRLHPLSATTPAQRQHFPLHRMCLFSTLKSS